MSRPVVVRPQAELELLEAERWYEERKPGLGEEFRAALEGILARVSTLPLSFPRVQGEKRLALVPRFPYGLYFRWSTSRLSSWVSCMDIEIPVSGHRGVEA